MPQTINSENVYIRAIHTIARYYDAPISYEAILANTSSHRGGSDPYLIIAGLESVSLRCKVIPYKLNKLHQGMFPCILIMDDQSPSIIYEEDVGYLLVDTLKGQEPQRIAVAEMEKRYSGKLIIINRALNDISTATFNKLSEKSNWLFSTLSHYRGIYIYSLMAAFFATIMNMAPVLYTRVLYDKVIPHAAYDTMMVVTCGVIVVITFDILVGTIKAYLLDFINRNADIILSNKLIHKVLNISLGNHYMLAGALAGRVRELEVLRDYMSSVAITALVDLPFSVLFLCLIYYFGNFAIVSACLASITMIVVISIITRKLIQDYSQITHEFGHKKMTYLVEAILGLEVIKSNIAEERYAGVWSEISEAQANAAKMERNLNAISSNLMVYIQNLNYIAIVVIGAYLVIENKLSIGALVACSVLGAKILAPFMQVGSLLLRYKHIKMAYDSLTNIMLTPSERQQEHRFISKSSFLGEIEFQGVSFSYKGESKVALNDLSFVVKQGEKIAVLGSIGSGKSTIGRLILSLYKPTQGNIFIDGIDIQKLHPYDLRSHISYVSQENFMFSTSIIDNIMVSPLVRSGDAEDVQQAINIAGINQVLAGKKDGLKTEVGQGGSKLSGGQRQAIAIARGLANDAPILILDEPTSMMDSSSEASLWQGLSTLKDKTMIIISHNLRVLDFVDKVLFVENGSMKFYGSKLDFMKLANEQKQGA